MKGGVGAGICERDSAVSRVCRLFQVLDGKSAHCAWRGQQGEMEPYLGSTDDGYLDEKGSLALAQTPSYTASCEVGY